MLRLAITQVFGQDQVVPGLFDGPFRCVHESHLICPASLSETLRNIGGNGHGGPAQLAAQPIGFLPGKTCTESICGQHKFVGLPPDYQIAEGFRGRSWLAILTPDF
jgi:hypothetical protein